MDSNKFAKEILYAIPVVTSLQTSRYNPFSKIINAKSLSLNGSRVSTRFDNKYSFNEDND